MRKWDKEINARTLVVLTAFILIVCVLIGSLVSLAIVNHDYYLGKVLDNLIQESVIPAERGRILDRNGQALAVNVTTYRVFISPADILEEDREKIAKALSTILGVDIDEIRQRMLKTNRKDETIKKNVEKEEADKVREFISENKYTQQIYLEASTRRYYPYKNLAAQVIGYMGTDEGLFGLELKYNDLLTGTDGRYVSARDAKNQSMPSKYETKTDAQDGYTLQTTLDMNIQAILQNYLEQTYKENLAGNNVCGIVMDVHTGGILAMSTNWGFDLNTPFVLTDEYSDVLRFSGLDKESEEYNALKWELIYNMWKNKCVTDTYEPGSTFKIITAAIALETGAVTPEMQLTCAGSLNVAGTEIKCHKVAGHGTNTFAYLLQQSCNPAIMQVAERVGRETFWNYFEEFGYTEKTGIDLPGEAAGINHSFSRFNAVELATSSFGQTFKTTPIQQITAVSAVANGGYIVRPHLVDALLDSSGNVVVSYEDQNEKRQIISSEVCRELSDILREGVLTGVAKNAYVAGYRVAAKTGTSEKRDEEDKTLRVGSTVAFAPADDPQIAVLIVVDEPGTPVKSGGTVAAPYVAGVIDETLQYLGVGRIYSEAELSARSFEVGDYTVNDLSYAVSEIAKAEGIESVVIGTGTKVYAQIPEAGERIQVEGGKIYLYVCDAAQEPPEAPDTTNVVVPNVVNYSDSENYKVSSAISILIAQGLNVRLVGSLNYESGSGARVMSQSIPPNTVVPRGTVIVIESRHTDGVDDNN